MLLTAGLLLLLINPPPQFPKQDSTKACFWARTRWIGWAKHEKVMAYILFKMSSVLTTFCTLHLTTLHTPCTSPHSTACSLHITTWRRKLLGISVENDAKRFQVWVVRSSKELEKKRITFRLVLQVLECQSPYVLYVSNLMSKLCNYKN